MEAFITSTLLVALAEIGDKTQLLSFVLAARLRRPLAIIAGIFVATIANHALAGWVGAWIATFSLIAFFLAEMGDKTQFATMALAARFDSLLWVVLGTTLGMMAANIPAVLIGEKLAKNLPLKAIRWTAAAVFAATGVLTLITPA